MSASFAGPSHICSGCYFGFQQVKYQNSIAALSTNLPNPGVEGIFLVFAMNNVTTISLHYLLLSAGTLLPFVMVVGIFGFSISYNEEVCKVI